ncbi:hypothetical protein [Planktothrix paucivesiculata]|uniref:Uncharacterized protein n=1 Tax=Planktothrix paucivesiculata PCC 9631 TaxID=671071 RepID=A0A7Z9E1T5_9CYAN|nr:hypothetical protein [Planktothrix paucivesiculata]VXD18704.1 exported hypothetical protein [Planktothrix paucivesiculata PCC 9631]
MILKKVGFFKSSAMVLTGFLSSLIWVNYSLNPVQAEVIFASGEGNGSFGLLSDFDGQYFSGQQQIGYEFIIQETVEIDQIDWNGQYFPDGQPSKPQFSLRIFKIVEGKPEIKPHFQVQLREVRQTKTNIERFSHPVFNYGGSVIPFKLEAGRYMLSIVNNTQGHTDDWLWMTTDPKTQLQDGDLKIFFRDRDDLAWKSGLTGKMSFTIFGNPTSNSN